MDVTDLGDRLVPEMPGLLRYARSLTSDPGRAEDLVQETLTRALQSAGTFRAESSLATWLHRILHNLAVDAARRDREVPDLDVVADEVERRWRQDAYTVDAVEVAARAETRAEGVAVAIAANQPDDSSSGPRLAKLSRLIVGHEGGRIGRHLTGLALRPVDDLKNVSTGDVSSLASVPVRLSTMI
ncbi:hypothetical protein GA707_10330 [Nostocoides sp. F2B08]|uniref:sigma factor n=1 Tax=Nostocoides sp. F2B08 TaxID=2653936 RepID=UPI0012630DA4|nr:sigma factor [Tetrasphaera sp. F2B08]KAB7743876.1 hypothetical protein GA707_10330 [Tetrasphaera sp. F2B08]